MNFTFVEMCAGLAAVSLHLLGEKPVVSRIGCKTGYASAICEELGIAGRVPDRVVLVDSDPLVVEHLKLLFDTTRRERAATRIEILTASRELWERARAAVRSGQSEYGDIAVDWLLYTAGGRGGVGGFKGGHVHRPSVVGFTPSLSSLARRLHAFKPTHTRVEVLCADARSIAPIPYSVVYIDPPYEGRTGFGRILVREHLHEVAERWAGAALIGVSDDRPLPLAGWRHVDITSRRVGQRRRSLTTNAIEWLTVSP